MAQFTLIPMDAAKAAVLPPRRAVQEEYRQFIRQLSPESGGQLVLGEHEKPITIRARLRSAAQAEGVNLQVRRRGNTVVFWISEEAPEPRSKPKSAGAKKR